MARTPRELSPELIRLSSEHWPLNDKDRMESVCNHLDELDKALWNKNDMGNWVTTTYVWGQNLAFFLTLPFSISGKLTPGV